MHFTPAVGMLLDALVLEFANKQQVMDKPFHNRLLAFCILSLASTLIFPQNIL